MDAKFAKIKNLFDRKCDNSDADKKLRDVHQ